MNRLAQDVRFGLRLLWKDRGFTITALLTLGICIGANAAIFAIVNSVLLKPLPVPEADRLVLVYNSYPSAGVERGSTGVPDYYDRLRETDVFEELALHQQRGMTIGGEGADPQRITGKAVRPSLLRMLRVQPLAGRIFTEEEGEIGENRKVILSYALWQEQFGGKESAISGTLRINGDPHTIVGVLPRDFQFMNPEVRLWIPLAFPPALKSDNARHSNSWTMVGRLRPGATVAQAQQQIDALNARNLERFPNLKQILVDAGFKTVVTNLQEDMIREVRSTLYLLWGGVLFVLAIGAVNLTNLVLVRSSSRMKELATRHALGAALSRLTRQLLTETVLLTAAGGVAGLLIGYLGLQALGGAGLDQLPRGSEVRMDTTAVLFTLGLALVVGMLVGLVPVLNMRNMNLSQAFREEGRSATTGRGARAVRRVLVASQVAFAFMLLIGAGLLLASFERVLAVDTGFEPAGVLTARVSLPGTRYRDDVARNAFSERLLERVRALPGVKQAGITTSIPFGGDFSDGVIIAEGYQRAPGESLISPYRVSASPGYVEALGIPVRRGRTFNASDTKTSPLVVIVDERLARKFWPGADPVGRRMFRANNPEEFDKPGPSAIWYTVVGVVGTTKMAGLVTTDDRPGTYYFPVSQSTPSTMTLAISTSGDPLALTAGLRQELRAIDPELPLYSIRTMEDRVSETLVDRKTPMMLAVLFAVVALFLAAVGIYGVLAYQVSQRSKEIGIRMALGSDARGIFVMIVREGMALLAAGFAVGLVGAFGMRNAMEAQLYGTSGLDPVVIGSVAAVLGLVALTACLLPARRAARIDPMIALNESV